MTDKLFAYLSYQDARKALDWLSAIGFSVIRTQLGDNNVVDHAELRRGQAVVMLASSDRPCQRPQLLGLSTGAGLYLLVDDVEQIYRQAILFGATSVISPESTPWGSTRARVIDFEGYEWSFGSYEPGSAW